MNEQIQLCGINDFLFEIWYSVKTRGDLVYMEIKEQYDHDVLTATLNGEPAFYNRAIGAVKFIPAMEDMDAILQWRKTR